MMLQLITSVTLLIVSVNQIFLVWRLQHTRRAVSAIMDLLIKKWTLEMQVGQAQVDLLIDDAIKKMMDDN